MCKNKELREQLAALCHKQWSGWIDDLFSKCRAAPDGTYTIPRWAAERWCRQMITGYKHLSQKEQDSDRKEADRIIALVYEYLDVP